MRSCTAEAVSLRRQSPDSGERPAPILDYVESLRFCRSAGLITGQVNTLLDVMNVSFGRLEFVGAIGTRTPAWRDFVTLCRDVHNAEEPSTTATPPEREAVGAWL